MPTAFANSFLRFLENSLCLTGNGVKRPFSATVVPTPPRDTGFCDKSLPLGSYSSFTPTPPTLEDVLVVTDNPEDRAAREDRASPRKPNVSTEFRSSNWDSFEV